MADRAFGINPAAPSDPALTLRRQGQEFDTPQRPGGKGACGALHLGLHALQVLVDGRCLERVELTPIDRERQRGLPIVGLERRDVLRMHLLRRQRLGTTTGGE